MSWTPLRDAMPRAAQRQLVLLAGNPNVGKSTLFNALTGLDQHTGNWAGKTVELARGAFAFGGRCWEAVDLPGCYSLLTSSPEEAIAREALCFGGADLVLVVADAACLERSLNLALQAAELCPRVLLCLNLMDQAKRRGLVPEPAALEAALGIPVAGISARDRQGMDRLLERMEQAVSAPAPGPLSLAYDPAVEAAAALLLPRVEVLTGGCGLPARWLALRLLEGDEALLTDLDRRLPRPLSGDRELSLLRQEARQLLHRAGLDREGLQDSLVGSLLIRAEELAALCIRREKAPSRPVGGQLDRLFTSRLTGIPILLGLLALIFWLTLCASGPPSESLSRLLLGLEAPLQELLAVAGAPPGLTAALTEGVYRTVAWVISVMLPPMAIFFPLFSFLEEAGYLPRAAFNTDALFRRCGTCGKQCLTMCMGFGCNACGVLGCRIIDSPRERLIAILTNCLVPCNGRFPTLLALLTLFFAGGGGPWAALFLLILVLAGVGMSLLLSRLLSSTALQGIPSSFTLELPSFRLPRMGPLLLRALRDRTLFVLGRALLAAAPAGLGIWLLANFPAEGPSFLIRAAHVLEPFGLLLGMDGAILLAFFLGFPAGELVLPILLMCYLSTGSLADAGSLSLLQSLLPEQGWTRTTALCTMLFCLMHFPCAATLLTIARETRSPKWTVLSVILPLAAGSGVCMAVSAVSRLWG